MFLAGRSRTERPPCSLNTLACAAWKTCRLPMNFGAFPSRNRNRCSRSSLASPLRRRSCSRKKIKSAKPKLPMTRLTSLMINEAPPAGRRLIKMTRGAYVLFAIGGVLGMVGFAIQVWFGWLSTRGRGSRIEHAGVEWLVAFPLAGLLCWVIAPFLTKFPIWAKIGLSVSAIVVWSLLGNFVTFVFFRVLGLPNGAASSL